MAEDIVNPRNDTGDVEFVELREEHLDKILKIYNYYVINTTATLHINPLSRDKMREIVFFDDPKYRTYVIFKHKSICGYVTLTQYKNREAYDETGEVIIYLKPDCIGEGLGSLGLQFIEKHAKRHSFHALMAVVCDENKKSIKLFERNGYFKCGHYREVGKKFNHYMDVVAFQKII